MDLKDDHHRFFVYRAHRDEVVDGDTYDVVVDCGFSMFKRLRVRLDGVDTAETYGIDHESDEYQRGMKQANWVAEWFNQAHEAYDGRWPLVIRTFKDETGKYGRFIAEIYRRDTAASLSDGLIIEFPSVAR